MNNRAFTISLVVALLAVVFVNSYVTSTIETTKQQYGAEVPVVIAKKNIQELEILDETNLIVVDVPKNYLQPGAGSKIEEFKGSLAIAPILEKEQITRTKVTQLGARTGLSRQVAVGKRAVTIPIRDFTGISKLLKPGDRVDVIAKIDPASGNKELIEIRTILQDVLVLATGKYVANTVPGILEADPFKKGQKHQVSLTEYTDFTTVTLEVDPIQAQQIVYLETVMDGVYLSLRNNDDNVQENLSTATLDEVMGRDSKRAQRRADQAIQDDLRRKNMLRQQDRKDASQQDIIPGSQ